MVEAAISKSSVTLFRALNISRGEADIASVDTTLITLRTGPTAIPGETPIPLIKFIGLLMMA